MIQGTVGVVARAEVLPNVFLMHLRTPEIAKRAHPGQFIHLACDDASDPLLRRPLSVHRIGRAGVAGAKAGIYSPSDRRESSSVDLWRPAEGEVSVLFARIGKGTTALARSNPGDALSAIGPLGNGFSFDPKARNLLLVAGGLGIAPLVALADEAVEREMVVTLLAGARTESGILPAAALPPEIEYVVCTEDGSHGRQGVVTGAVAEFVDWADQIFVCGPRPMVEALIALRISPTKSAQVALEEHMACGIGACLGCIVQTRRGPQRVCRDGPVFRLGDLR
ncbi:MAG: dihydroorotate dehydrogenase electron transfer subunit [Chloroflexi bacterium]|nr:dihydroorotate dehydrogenase electron transfer subunit [Chloroflexota bacterium]